jgi:hypothetical protein
LRLSLFNLLAYRGLEIENTSCGGPAMYLFIKRTLQHYCLRFTQSNEILDFVRLTVNHATRLYMFLLLVSTFKVTLPAGVEEPYRTLLNRKRRVAYAINISSRRYVFEITLINFNYNHYAKHSCQYKFYKFTILRISRYLKRFLNHYS